MSLTRYRREAFADMFFSFCFISYQNSRRSNIFFNITSPIPGTFIIALHYKGRDKAILEMDLKLDDLLEKVTHQEKPLRLAGLRINFVDCSCV